jgi:C-terminal peptidase prc
VTDRFPAARLVLASVLILATVPFVAGPAWAQQESPAAPSAAAPASCPVVSPAPIPAPSAPMVMPQQFRVGLLDDVWQQLNDQYIDPAMNGVDWASVHTDYAQRIQQSVNAYQAYATLTDMVALLQDPDTFFVSSPDLQALAPDPSTGGAGVLVDATTAADPSQGLRIVYVFPGSPAEAAGIHARDVIVGVAGDPCPRSELVRGPIGSTVSLQVRSPGEATRTVDIQRQRIAPSYPVTPERAAHAKSIGYLRLLSMAGDTADQVSAALTQLLDQGNLSGLVLDLRHASAGDPAVTKAILGQFTGGAAGMLVDRNGTTPYVIEAQPLRDQLRDVPVAVLVDAATDGEAERLAAVLQAQGRAKVIGQRTAGHTQLTQQTSLPEGSLLQLVTGGMLLPDGTRLEGHGVIPDIAMEDDWLSQPAGDDTWTAAAVKELRHPSSTAQAVAP